MDHALTSFLFGIYPYIALTVFLVGSLIRFDREQFTWRSGSSQLLRRRQLRLGSNLFHLGILVVFVGHLVGLLTPVEVFDAFGVQHAFKQLAAIVVGGTAAVFALIGATLLLHRRLFDARIRKTSAPMDHAILIILWLQLVLGILTIPVSLGHMDGHMMVLFMNWATGVFTFQPVAAELIEAAHWVMKLHIFLGLTVFLIFPFTRLVHIWSAPFGYVGRRGWQIVRSRRTRSPVDSRYPS
ncbi:MAG: respiratory nitrate reductase subunit gamma [Rhodospirillaceae bacterium]|nr:respiratory nitrate reductase subunit gamma [Rhodospirillaceae bacterium]